VTRRTSPAAPAVGRSARPGQAFIATKQHRRFVEFANAVRREGYIGLCYGPAGVGKTLSARRYAHWERAEPSLWDQGLRPDLDSPIYAALNRSRTVFYTPPVTLPLRQLDADLDLLTARLDSWIDHHLHPTGLVPARNGASYVELLIIDEAERLKPAALETLRDRFDRRHLGLILIGMPGSDKRLARYPQLYSRIGFAHHYQPLTGDELTFVLTRHWRNLGLDLDTADFSDVQAMAAIARITGGNFRLLQRLFAQIQRIMAINELTTITDDVVHAARSTLVIGTA
jgi:DNA transposition AAA+ family ATPase